MAINISERERVILAHYARIGVLKSKGKECRVKKHGLASYNETFAGKFACKIFDKKK